MKLEMERMMDRVTLGRMLIQLGRQIAESGVIELSGTHTVGSSIQLPDSLLVEVEYKQKRDKKRGGIKNKFELEFKWTEGELAKDKYIETKTIPIGQKGGSPKEVKKALGACWGKIRVCLSNNTMPIKEQIARFDELNKAFNKHTKSKWKNEMRVYLKAVADFVAAVHNNNLAVAQDLGKQLTVLISDCHEQYK